MIDYVKRLAGPFTSEGQKELPFGFLIFQETDVSVATAYDADAQSTPLVYGQDFTVQKNPNQNATPGGTVVLTTPITKGQIVVIGSQVEYTQEMQLSNYSRFPPEIINLALDRIVVQIQQIVEKLGRTLSVPQTGDSTPEQLIERLLSAQNDARQFADQAAQSADEAKKSEEATKEYAEAATVIVPFKDEIKTVADNIGDVVSTGQAIEDVKTVAGHVANVDVVAQNIEDVKVVAAPANVAAYQTVAAIREEVVTTAGIDEEIVKVAGMKLAVENVSQNMPSVNDVHQNMSDVKTVAGDLEGGQCVPVKWSAGRLSSEPAQDCSATGGSIVTVSDNIKDVRTVADAVEDGRLELAAEAVETVKENLRAAQEAQGKAEAARDAAKASEENAKASEVSADESEALAKAWATQTDAPVEGELYGAKYYAEQAESAEGFAGDAAEAAQAAEASAQKSHDWAEKLDGPVSGNQYSARFWVQRAEQEARNASGSAKEAKASETASAQSEANAKASETNAEASETEATKQADRAEAEADRAAANANSAHFQMVEQLIAFWNNYYGDSLDYRDYLGLTQDKIMEAFYAMGIGYEGVTEV